MSRSDDTKICDGPTCRAAVRFVTIEGSRVLVDLPPDPNGSVVVFGKDTDVRMTSDQRATLMNGTVYMEHNCPDVVYLRLKRREQHPQRRYAGGRR